MRFTIPALALVLSPLALSSSPAEESDWRSVDPDNVLLITTDQGPFSIELNNELAPIHAAHMRKMARSGFFDQREFYRVIENFVVQGGSGDDMESEGNRQQQLMIPGEINSKANLGSRFTTTGNGDQFAAETGLFNGFSVGRNPQAGTSWLTHCNGAVGMARNDSVDSGGTDWYVVIGHAPRYLDQNITVFGRVIDGLRVVQSAQRGNSQNSGLLDKEQAPLQMIKTQVLSDIPESIRPIYEVKNTHSKAFREYISSLKNRNHKWFITTPSAQLDVCSIRVETRKSSPDMQAFKPT